MGNGGNISNDLLLNYDVGTDRRITQSFINQINVFSVMSPFDVVWSAIFNVFF